MVREGQGDCSSCPLLALKRVRKMPDTLLNAGSVVSCAACISVRGIFLFPMPR